MWHAPRRDRIAVRGGDYFLAATIAYEGRDAVLEIVAAEGEAAVLHGGIEVSGWTQTAPGRWAARVGRPEGANVRGLFLDGRRQEEARYPNAPADGDPRRGWLFALPRDPGEESLVATQFRVGAGDLPHLNDLGGLVAKVVGGYLPNTQWGSDTLPVLSIDEAQALVHVAVTGYFLSGARALLDAPGE